MQPHLFTAPVYSSPRPAHQQASSKIYFTLPMVRLLKDAMCALEGMLSQNADTLPNIPFASEVAAGLKTELDDMLQLEDWQRETPFDYNEIHILYAAVHIYLVKLKFSQKEDVILLCIKLCRQFRLIVESVPMKQHTAN